MGEATPYHPHHGGTLIDIVVQPRASKSEITVVHDGALRVRIAAAPVDGAANDAIIELLSKRLKVRKSDVQIVSGATGRRKRVLVRGVHVEQARDALSSQPHGS
jgi:uncharacterized protein (TIGR00251 family)